MAVKKRGLGRGLDALLGGGSAAKSSNNPEPEANKGATQSSALSELNLSQLQRGQYQPRTHMEPEALEELADSIRAQGVVQPIVVRALAKKDTYEIIAGERRWRASQIAGLTKVPVIVRNVSDNAAMAIGLIENIQRENLNPIEEANALRRLIDEFEMTHEQCAEAVGRSRASVSNLLRLIELNNDVKLLLEKRQIEMGHARALLGLNGAEQSRLAAEVVERKLSVRETEQLVRKSRLPVIPENKNKATAENPDIRRLQDNLSEQLGAAVKIDHKAVGKGKLVIQYNTLDELDGILAHIK